MIDSQYLSRNKESSITRASTNQSRYNFFFCLAKPQKKTTQTEQKELLLDHLTYKKYVGGSNGGGLYVNKDDGKEYFVKSYLKFCTNEQDIVRMKSEVFAEDIYKISGVCTLNSSFIKDKKGKLYIYSQWNSNVKTIEDKFKESLDFLETLSDSQKQQLSDIYLISVLIQNYDVVGSNYDNLMIDKDGNFVVCDAGASFKFKAQGAPKPYENNIEYYDNFLHEKTSEPGWSIAQKNKIVFSQIRNDDFSKKSLEKICSIPDSELDLLAKKYDLENLIEVFKKRREALVDRFMDPLIAEEMEIDDNKKPSNINIYLSGRSNPKFFQ